VKHDATSDVDEEGDEEEVLHTSSIIEEPVSATAPKEAPTPAVTKLDLKSSGNKAIKRVH